MPMSGFFFFLFFFLSRELSVSKKCLLSGPIGGKSGGGEMKVKQKSLCKKEWERMMRMTIWG